jgi:hypothetical protein
VYVNLYYANNYKITRQIEQLSSKLRSNLAALRPQQAATETSAEETVQQELETAMKELNNLLLLNNESAEEC